MKEVIYDWQPINEITTPLEGMPSFINSGIIKAVMTSGEKVSVARIDYEEFDEENSQYIIMPYWEIIDALPAKVFQGIPGIDMDMRLSRYYRVNYTPIFITERTPSKNREDLWDLLKSVGLDYYDRFEWLLRTTMRAANDNLIVERRRQEQKTVEYMPDIIENLQYGDRVIVENIESLGDTSASFSNNLFNLATNGIDVVTRDGKILIDINSRYNIVNIAMASRLLRYSEYMQKQQKGIERAKKEGKYKGRKPIDVDIDILREVAKELEKGSINISEAMRRTRINSRSTFYRKLKKYTKE